MKTNDLIKVEITLPRYLYHIIKHDKNIIPETPLEIEIIKQIKEEPEYGNYKTK